MAKPAKRRIEGASAAGSPAASPKAGSKTSAKSSAVAGTGRTTAKGTRSDGSAPAASTRYTPPAPTKYDMPSPMWVPVVMFSFFGIGLLMIFLNYTNVLPGAPTQWYLLGGLVSILAGIITATQLR